jgi:hypothetical protein
MKNKIIAMLLIPFLILLSPIKSFADTISYFGSALISPPKYYPQFDKYMASFNKDIVVHVEHRGYSDATYQHLVNVWDFYSPNDNGDVFTGVINWNCKDTYFEDLFYDSNGRQVGFIRLYSNEIQVGKCTSGPYPKDTQDKQDFQSYIDSGGLDCAECKVFKCPEWGNNMGKMDELIKKIPQPPDWHKVADIFRDSIVPKIINDLSNLLGKAPNIPKPPPQPSLNDHNIKNNNPSGDKIPGLDQAQFDVQKIKNEAPVIQERQDPTGGFKLLNPIDSLPKLPTDDFPEPGKTNAGAWDHQPSEPDNPYPKNPKDTGDPNTGESPIPKDDGGDPPNPDDKGGNSPIPKDDGDNGGMKYYKPTPDSKDGTGGDYSK